MGWLSKRNPFSRAGAVPMEQKEMGIPGGGKSVSATLKTRLHFRTLSLDCPEAPSKAVRDGSGDVVRGRILNSLLLRG